jgi:hypothetical protein
MLAPDSFFSSSNTSILKQKRELENIDDTLLPKIKSSKIQYFDSDSDSDSDENDDEIPLSEEEIYKKDLQKIFKTLNVNFECPGPGYCTYSINDSSRKFCTTIYIYFKRPKKYIHISLLTKCSFTGSEILTKIKQFARKNNFNYISLSDESYLEFECLQEEQIPVLYKNNIETSKKHFKINLAFLNLLKTGYSWYNKFGYFSKNTKKEIEHNKQILNMPMFDFIELVKSKILNTQFQKDDYKIDTFKDVYSSFDLNLPVSVFFQKIDNNLRGETNFCQSKYVFLADFLDIVAEITKGSIVDKDGISIFFNDFLNYDNYLQLQLKGGLRKKTLKKKRKNKKSKKNIYKY